MVIADAAHIDKCKEIEMPYIDADGLKKKIDPTDKKSKVLKKWAKNYKLFFISESLIRQLPKLGGPLLAKMGRFPSVIGANDNFKKKIDEGKNILDIYPSILAFRVFKSN